jgi:thiamine-phosphate pyrophosphorylase
MTLPFRLYVLSDRTRMGEDPAGALVTVARAGLRAFQWREKDLTPAENHASIQALVRRADQEGLLRVNPCDPAGPRTDRLHLFVNDRADLALALCLDLHLTEKSLPTKVVRGILHPGQLIGRSTHDLAGARQAEAEGADFVTFGPVYETASKREYGPPAGLSRLEEVCRALSIPVLAIGGVDQARAGECMRAGAAGIAVIGAVWGAADPAASVGELLRAVAPE